MINICVTFFKGMQIVIHSYPTNSLIHKEFLAHVSCTVHSLFLGTNPSTCIKTCHSLAADFLYK